MRDVIPRCARPQFAVWLGAPGFLLLLFVCLFVVVVFYNLDNIRHLSLMTTQGGGGVALLCLFVFVFVTLHPCLVSSQVNFFLS